jgi:hypothetical protein
MNKELWYLHQLTQDELKVFVEESRIGKSNNKAFIGTVTPAADQRIEAICGKKVGKIMLESGAVRHSYSKDYHLLENDDIFHYTDVVNTATDVWLSGKKHLNNEVMKNPAASREVSSLERKFIKLAGPYPGYSF